jgi:hypothetical protein
MPRGYKVNNWSKNIQLEGSLHSERLEHGSTGIAIVRNSYQATTSENTVCWRRFSMCSIEM